MALSIPGYSLQLPNTCSVSHFVPDFVQQNINTLGVSHTHTGLSPVWRAVSVKSPHHQQNQLHCQKCACVAAVKVCGHEPLLGSCIPCSSTSSDKCPPPSAVCAPWGGAGSWGPGWQNSHLSQAVTVQSSPSLCPSLCYLLVFRHNQNKLWCLMTPPLLCAKHLKKPQVH